MSTAVDRLAHDKRLMAYTAAAMYGGASLDGAVEGFIPGDPSFALVPVIVAMVIVAALVAFGPRFPRPALALLGPLGVVLIAYALSATPGAGDGAVLYVWPVLWSCFFFGRRGAVSVLACIAVAHAITLLALPAQSSYPGRWVDVMVVTTVLAAVVLTLVERNDRLLTRLADEARTDALTGLLNRRGFDERALVELAHARREAISVAVVVFDIDYFKRINDEWGHDAGDRVLRALGDLLARESRDIDVTARVGGEEFVVLLPGTDARGGEEFASRVRAAVAEQRSGDLPAIRVSAGIDGELAPASLESMLQRADSALYLAKRGGRDRAVSFTPAESALAAR